MSGTPVITATPNATYAYVSLSVTGLTGYDTITVSRTNPDGSVATVRGASSISTGGVDSWAGFDYEAPLGQSVSYSVTATASVGSSVNSNQTFESGAGSWTPFNATFDTSTLTAHGGTYSGHLTANGSGAAYTESDKGPVAPGDVLSLSAWIFKSDSYSPGENIGVSFYTSSGTYITTVSTANVIPPVNTWTQIQGSGSSFTVPSNAGYATLLLQISGSPPLGNQGWWDDAYLTRNKAASVTVQSSSVTIPVAAGTAWLKNLSQASLSTQVTVSALGDVKRPARLQAYPVVGRRNPVVISDVRQGRTGTITLTTSNSTDTGNLKLLLDSGQVLFFQATPGDAFDDLYFAAGDVTIKRPGVSTDPTRLWAIDFIEVDSPSGNLTTIPGNSYLAVDKFTSYQDLLNNRTSYLDVLNHAYGT